MKKLILKRILPIVCIVCLISAIALPIVAQFTYADTADAPKHILNYDTNKLYWSDGTPDIDEFGSCHLSLFAALPVDETTGEKLISPGDEGKSIVRLRNTTSRKVIYKAVLYRITETDVPVSADLPDFDKANDEQIYTLPSGVTKDSVVRAIGGELAGNAEQDIAIEWIWEFSTGDEGDAFDTYLADLERADVRLGLYITVSDNAEITPEPPDVDIDTDGDGNPDINIDTDGDKKPEVNIDTDEDKKPNINIDTDGDKKPDTNIDISGDGTPDINLDSDGDGTADTNKHDIPVDSGNAVLPESITDTLLGTADENGNITLKLDNLGEHITSTDLPKSLLDKMIAEGGKLRIVMTNLVVVFDAPAIETIVASATTDLIRVVAIEIVRDNLSAAQSAALEGKQTAIIVRAYVMSGDTVISEFGEGTATLYAPYTVSDKVKVSDFKTMHLTEDGKLNSLEYKYEDSFFVFTVEHFSEFAVIYTGQGDISGEIPPAPPVPCTCIICLFGGNCTSCILCWTFVILMAVCLLGCIIMYLWRRFE